VCEKLRKGRRCRDPRGDPAARRIHAYELLPRSCSDGGSRHDDRDERRAANAAAAPPSTERTSLRGVRGRSASSLMPVVNWIAGRYLPQAVRARAPPAARLVSVLHNVLTAFHYPQRP
jgi:hypothetical protein